MYAKTDALALCSSARAKRAAGRGAARRVPRQKQMPLLDEPQLIGQQRLMQLLGKSLGEGEADCELGFYTYSRKK